MNKENGAAVKRAFDIAAAGMLIVLTSPLMLFTSIGVRLSSPGPVLFRQERTGLNGGTFLMYKFRSMRVNNMEKTGWTTADDPRITKFGAFIRKYSLDELPQFFNVIKGDMSLVGPRPETPYYVDIFKETIPDYTRRLEVLPGITGWAQVNGLRGDTSIEDRVKYDLWYIENRRLILDIKIVLKTAFGAFING